MSDCDNSKLPFVLASSKSPPVGDLFKEAIKARTQKEADRLLALIVDRLVEQEPGASRADLESNARERLAYHAGYYDRETRLRVERLYKAEHPVLGSAERNLTASELFLMGTLVGQLAQRGMDIEQAIRVARQRMENDRRGM